jgi:hypothetical protein
MFCEMCGRLLIKKGSATFCPRHGSCWHKGDQRQKIGRWSGKSKRPYGAYEKF